MSDKIVESFQELSKTIQESNRIICNRINELTQIAKQFFVIFQQQKVSLESMEPNSFTSLFSTNNHFKSLMICQNTPNSTKY